MFGALLYFIQTFSICTLFGGQFVRTQVEDISMSSSVLAQGIMGLVVACRQYPNDVVKEMMPFLHPGHSFVVFSPYKEVRYISSMNV